MRLPGIGQLMINSIFARDFPVVQAVTLVFSVMVVLVYLLSDVVHALLDPQGEVRVVAITVDAVAAGQVIEQRRGFRGRWYRTPSFVAGVTILGLILLAAVCAPLITQYGPLHQDLNHTLQGPSGAHWLGHRRPRAATPGRVSSTAPVPTCASRSWRCCCRS